MKVYEQFGADVDEKTLEELIDNRYFEHIHNLRVDRLSFSKSEFILLVLSIMNKVEEQDVMHIQKLFAQLNSDNDGILKYTDVRNEMQKARKRDALAASQRSAASTDNAASRLSTMRSTLRDTFLDVKHSIEGVVNIM